MEAKAKSRIDVTIQITISEDEARALDAIMGYGAKGFIEGFYKQMGKHYLMPYEHAVPSLFAGVRTQIAPILEKADKAREVFFEK